MEEKYIKQLTAQNGVPLEKLIVPQLFMKTSSKCTFATPYYRTVLQ